MAELEKENVALVVRRAERIAFLFADATCARRRTGRSESQRTLSDVFEPRRDVATDRAVHRTGATLTRERRRTHDRRTQIPCLHRLRIAFRLPRIVTAV